MPDSVNSPGQSEEYLDCPFFISERQLDCLRLAAQGQTDQVIARQLLRKDGQPISVRTVRAHLQAARAALGALNTTHAVAIALSRRLIAVITAQGR